MYKTSPTWPVSCRTPSPPAGCVCPAGLDDVTSLYLPWRHLHMTHDNVTFMAASQGTVQVIFQLIICSFTNKITSGCLQFCLIQMIRLVQNCAFFVEYSTAEEWVIHSCLLFLTVCHNVIVGFIDTVVRSCTTICITVDGAFSLPTIHAINLYLFH